MTNFTSAKKTLQEHNTQKTHRVAMEDAVAFLGQMESGHLSIDQQLQSQALETFKKNRLILKSILKAIIFCGKQNIALRGHRETSNLVNIEDETSINVGNFRALLRLQIESGDEVLKEHFTNAPRNAQYSSPTIQNELISAIGTWFQQQIVKTAQYFAVCADEAIDSSNKEQLQLVLRYADKQSQAREEFIEFVHCDTGTSGRAIADKILYTLQRLSLDPRNLRGQAYDGAGNMAGKYQGAATLIQNEFPKTSYFHCAAHILNLCVVAACKVQSVRNVVGVLEQVCLFFIMSPKRHEELAGHITSLPEGETSRTKLVNICKMGGKDRVI